MKSIAEWDHVDKTVFETDIRPAGQPAVLRGLVRDWPLLSVGSPEAMRDVLLKSHSGVPVPFFEAPPEVHGRFFYNDRLDDFNFFRRRAPLAQFFAKLVDNLSSDMPPGLYAGSLSMDGYFPGLDELNSITALLPASDPIKSVWIGNRTLIAPHYDNTENIACVVMGRRRFTLFPIEHYANLYPGPPDFTPAGQTVSMVDLRAPDLTRFPKYQQALEAAQTTVLEPGDAIYIPTLWWHGVESLDPFAVMVNYWWRDVPDYFDTPHNTLLHALLSLKDLPKAQRTAWQHVFDRLIFQPEDFNTSHWPATTRTLMGPLTAAKAEQIRALLIRTLQN